MTITSTLVLVVFFFGSYFCYAESYVSSSISIPYGTLEMGLRSRSPIGNYNGTTDRFVMDVLSATVNFLDSKMKEFFGNDDRVQFRRVAASYRGYEIRQEQESSQSTVKHYEADISITGVAIFTTEFAPTRDIVVTVVEEAFINDMDGFLKRIWDISRDPFLRETSTSVVVVNSTVPDDATSDPTSDPTMPVAPNDKRVDGWLMGLIVGVAVSCVVLASCFAYVCTTKVDPPAMQDDVPIKSKSTASSGGTERENGADNETDVNTNTNFGNNLRSPSTVHSIGSQDSSLFTYNPKSIKSYMSNGSKTQGSGFFTANSGLEVDLQAWQNGGTVIKDENRAPFGHDISAITSKKDLSLIEEEDMNDLSGRLSGSTQYFKSPDGVISPRQFLTEAAVQDLEIAGRWGNNRTRNTNVTSQMESFSRDMSTYLPLTAETPLTSVSSKGVLSPNSMLNSKYGYSIGLNSNSKLDLEGSSSDVINDLKDLSYQIDSYRQRTMNN